MNPTVLVCTVLAGICAAIVGYLIRRRKRGCSGCSCGNCPMSGSCPHAK